MVSVMRQQERCQTTPCRMIQYETAIDAEEWGILLRKLYIECKII